MSAKRNTSTKSRKSSRTSDEAHRLFFAVSLPSAVRDRIQELISSPSLVDLPFRWVRPGNAHMTLHFLGDTLPESEALLCEALNDWRPLHPTIRVQTAQLGVFPGNRQPRVLWLGLSGQTRRFEHTHQQLGELLTTVGFDIEQRDFHPHITLGRARKELPSSFSRDVQRALSDTHIEHLCRQTPIAFSIDRVLLLRSHLESGGPRYETVMTLPLEREDR